MFWAFGSIYFLAVILIQNLNIISTRKNPKSSQNEDTLVQNNLKDIFKVDGTKWMILFVLFYKLCERSEQTFALYLVDKNVRKEELAVLSTFIRAFSIFGSTLSGILLTRSTPQTVIKQFSTLRAFTILGLTYVIFAWGLEKSQFNSQSDFVLKFTGFAFICLTSIGAGAVTTATFTLMMSLSQKAPNHVQGTHYALLATCEVLGKLIFAAFAGWFTDLVGLHVIFGTFSIFALLVIPFISFAPKSVLKSNKD